MSLSQQSRDSLENLPNLFEAASMCHRDEAFLPRGSGFGARVSTKGIA